MKVALWRKPPGTKKVSSQHPHDSPVSPHLKLKLNQALTIGDVEVMPTESSTRKSTPPRGIWSWK